MNLEVEALIRDLSQQLDSWPAENTLKVHELVSSAEMEKIISQLKSLQAALKADLDEA